MTLLKAPLLMGTLFPRVSPGPRLIVTQSFEISHLFARSKLSIRSFANVSSSFTSSWTFVSPTSEPCPLPYQVLRRAHSTFLSRPPTSDADSSSIPVSSAAVKPGPFTDSATSVAAATSFVPVGQHLEYELKVGQGSRNQSAVVDFLYRWADITGFLTRWFDRKAWVMDLEPSARAASVQLTEQERKLSMFMMANSIILFTISLVFWMQAQAHFAVKPPCPKPPDYPMMNNRRTDFTWHSKIPGISPRDRCKECRWLEASCKRECFDKLRAEGHVFLINGKKGPLTKPHYNLEEPHHGGSGGHH